MKRDEWALAAQVGARHRRRGLQHRIPRAGAPGDVLTCQGGEQVLHGRHGIFDMKSTNQHGDVVALFRGRSTRIKGHVVPEVAA